MTWLSARPRLQQGALQGAFSQWAWLNDARLMEEPERPVPVARSLRKFWNACSNKGCQERAGREQSSHGSLLQAPLTLAACRRVETSTGLSSGRVLVGFPPACGPLTGLTLVNGRQADLGGGGRHEGEGRSKNGAQLADALDCER